MRLSKKIKRGIDPKTWHRGARELEREVRRLTLEAERRELEVEGYEARAIESAAAIDRLKAEAKEAGKRAVESLPPWEAYVAVLMERLYVAAQSDGGERVEVSDGDLVRFSNVRVDVDRDLFRRIYVLTLSRTGP